MSLRCAFAKQIYKNQYRIMIFLPFHFNNPVLLNNIVTLLSSSKIVEEMIQQHSASLLLSVAAIVQCEGGAYSDGDAIYFWLVGP